MGAVIEYIYRGVGLVGWFRLLRLVGLDWIVWLASRCLISFSFSLFGQGFYFIFLFLL